jgi:hypothetical protein
MNDETKPMMQSAGSEQGEILPGAMVCASGGSIFILHPSSFIL